MDLDKSAIRGCKVYTLKTAAELGAQAECVLGSSPQLLAKLPDAAFDLIYVDGDHSYSGFCSDLEAARHKVRVGGILAINDFYLFESQFLVSRARFGVYGIIHATHEFLVRYEGQWEIAYYAFNMMNQGDLGLRRLK